MNRRNFLGTVTILLVASATRFPQMALAADTTAPHQDPDGFFTCPMHPQVHRHEPGKCPICGMPLTKVQGSKAKPTQKIEDEGFDVSKEQQQIIQSSKYKVERKDFAIELPVSGRAISSREIAFQVYESDLALLRPGLQFKGSSAISPEKILTGKITSVDRFIDPSSRTVRVTGSISEANTNLIHDSGFHAEISNTIKNQIIIPEDAVLRAGRRDLVYIITDQNKIVAREVILGAKSMREYQVLSGLKDGEIISGGPNFLFDSEAKLRGL